MDIDSQLVKHYEKGVNIKQYKSLTDNSLSILSSFHW